MLLLIKTDMVHIITITSIITIIGVIRNRAKHKIFQLFSVHHLILGHFNPKILRIGIT